MRKLALLALVFATTAIAADVTPLGVQVETNDTGKAGVIVLGVVPGSPAAKAGVSVGDIIGAVNNKPSPDVARFTALLAGQRGAVRLHILHPVVPATDVVAVLGGGGAGLPVTPQSGMPMVRPRIAANPPVMRPSPQPPLQHWPASAIRWTRYRDPNEGAFTINVPTGWRVTGGAYSVSATETRTMVEARSPDGATVLFFGDKDIPVFTVPNQMLAMGGFRPGSWYPVGFNQRLLVEPYQSGVQFASDWGTGRINRECPGARMTGARALPQAAQQMDYAYEQGGVRTSLQAGEAQFACGTGGAGYVFAATELVQTTGNAVWDVKHLAGFIAPAGHDKDAAGMLANFVASFRADPGWLARHNQVAMQVSHIVAQTGEAMANSISGAYWNKAASEEHISQARSEATLGIHTYHDPVDGHDYHLDNSASHWFIDGDGNKIPSESGTPPCQGCRELVIQH